ncbi:hypothetical protein EGW08_012395, partial [Elysia chlorotica]
MMHVYALILLAVTASFFIPSARTVELGCDELQRCSEDIVRGENGTATLMLQKVHPILSKYLHFLGPVCESREERTKCTQNHNCKDTFIANQAKAAYEVAKFMCSDDGEQYYRRIHEANLQCMGDPVLLDLFLQKDAECRRGGIQKITPSMGKLEKCELVYDSLYCSLGSIVEICGESSEWLLDTPLTVELEKVYTECMLGDDDEYDDEYGDEYGDEYDNENDDENDDEDDDENDDENDGESDDE